MRARAMSKLCIKSILMGHVLQHFMLDEPLLEQRNHTACMIATRTQPLCERIADFGVQLLEPACINISTIACGVIPLVWLVSLTPQWLRPEPLDRILSTVHATVAELHLRFCMPNPH